MLSSIILIAAVTATKADVRESPYEPSGWKPSGALLLLPTRNHATGDQFIKVQLPPLTSPQSTVNNSKSNTNFFTSSNPIPDRPLTLPPNRQFVPLFRVPQASTPDSYPSTTSPPNPVNDHRPSVSKDRNNLGRINPEQQNNQSFVYKLESVLSLVRPLQDSRRSDDPTLFNDQSQSQLPTQYLPSTAEHYETTATFAGFPPQTDNVAHVTSYSPVAPADDELFTYEAPPTDQSPVSDQQSSYVSPKESKLNAQRIFVFVLPVQMSTETESKPTHGLPFTSSGNRPQEESSNNFH